jgi:hypothetical protein
MTLFEEYCWMLSYLRDKSIEEMVHTFHHCSYYQSSVKLSDRLSDGLPICEKEPVRVWLVKPGTNVYAMSRCETHKDNFTVMRRETVELTPDQIELVRVMFG